MATIISPIQYPQEWDYIFIGQQKSPGLAIVGDFSREYEWDVKKGKGTVGATTTFVQKPPAKGSITFKLWKTEHFAEWEAFLLLLKYDPTKKATQAVDIYHPSLVSIDVLSVVTTDIGNPIHEGKQLYSVKVGFLEYFPAPKKSATNTPNGSNSNSKSAGGANGTPPDPIADAQQKQIADLLKKASEP